MIDWIKDIFSDRKSNEIIQWETSDSILEFLKKNIDTEGSLKESAQILPDEKKADNEIKFAPGLADAMFGVDGSEVSKTRVKELVKLITQVAKNGDEQSKSDFYREVTENESVIGIIDQFLEKLVQSSISVEPYLFSFSNKLATKTNNRSSVKFGIAILGLCQNKRPIEDLKILGLHDEFTVFSTVALSNLSDNLVDDLWQLAKRVDGWGKIQLVDRLAEMELPKEIIDWLVLEGYKNSVMYEYLALTCAINGNLNQKLSRESIDQSLFDSAGEIIVALMDEGAAEGMSGYNDAEEVIQNYIRHSKSKPLKIADFVTLHRVKDYLEESPEENEILKTWNENDLSDSLIDINQILTSKDWTSEVVVALDSSDNVEFWNGKKAAEKLELDISDALWKRLGKYPFESMSWYDITTYMKSENPQRIVDMAMSLIPIEEISTGPKDSMGVGPDWQKHQSLDFMITYLESHPTVGEEIILAGLKSPVIRNRNMTLRTLESWSSSNWSEEIKTELNKLKEIEPNSDTKSDLVKLLNGEKIR
tara:strand:- start:301 stop:1902 length:1602 start_codon:yes stop_codon:yes gene_type:complete